MKKTTSKKNAPINRSNSILVVERDGADQQGYTLLLLNAGFKNTRGVRGVARGESVMNRESIDLVFLELSSRDDNDDVFEFVSLVRIKGYTGAVVTISKHPSLENIYRAAVCGANDFLVEGPHLKIEREATRLLNAENALRKTEWNPNSTAELGLLYSLGLTGGEIKLLTEFAQDFSRQQILAERMGLSEAHIRRTFSRIYRKLEEPLAVYNQAQLSHLLTICALFN